MPPADGSAPDFLPIIGETCRELRRTRSARVKPPMRRTSIDGFMERSTLGAKASPLMRKRLRSTSKRSRKAPAKRFSSRKPWTERIPRARSSSAASCFAGRRILKSGGDSSRRSSRRRGRPITASSCFEPQRRSRRPFVSTNASDCGSARGAKTMTGESMGARSSKSRWSEVSKGLVQDAAAEAPRRRSFEPQALSGSNRAVVQIADPLPS